MVRGGGGEGGGEGGGRGGARGVRREEKEVLECLQINETSNKYNQYIFEQPLNLV